jgi:hypothetical protein
LGAPRLPSAARRRFAVLIRPARSRQLAIAGAKPTDRLLSQGRPRTTDLRSYRRCTVGPSHQLFGEELSTEKHLLMSFGGALLQCDDAVANKKIL